MRQYDRNCWSVKWVDKRLKGNGRLVGSVRIKTGGQVKVTGSSTNLDNGSQQYVEKREETAAKLEKNCQDLMRPIEKHMKYSWREQHGGSCQLNLVSQCYRLAEYD